MYSFYLKGYALCRRPPLSGRGLRGGGYVALAHLPCWVYWLLVVLSVLVFLWSVWKQGGFWRRILLFWLSKTYHLEACCLHFPTLGTILSAWGHPGGPWEQQEGHVGVRSKIFSDFGLILGLHFESFLSSDGLNSVFFWSLFPGHFLHRFLNGIIDRWSSENKVFAGKVLQKPCFRKNRLLVIRGSIFGVFWRLWEQVFWVFLPWKQAWKFSVFQGRLGDPGWHHKIRGRPGSVVKMPLFIRTK